MRKVLLAAALLGAAVPVLAGSKEEVFEKAYSMDRRHPGLGRERQRAHRGDRLGEALLQAAGRQEGRRLPRRGDAAPDRDPRPQGRRRDPRRDGQPEAPARLRLPRLRRVERARGLRPPDPGQGRGPLRDLQRQGRWPRAFSASSRETPSTDRSSSRASRGRRAPRPSTARCAWRSTARSRRAGSRPSTARSTSRSRSPRRSATTSRRSTAHIEGDFDLPVEGKFGPKEARGKLNGGGESLHCETVNGTIRLRTQ